MDAADLSGYRVFGQPPPKKLTFTDEMESKYGT